MYYFNKEGLLQTKRAIEREGAVIEWEGSGGIHFPRELRADLQELQGGQDRQVLGAAKALHKRKLYGVHGWCQ